MSLLKRLAIGLSILLLVAFAGCLHLMGSEPVPETTAYRIDLPRLEALARSLPGELPSEIRFENIADGAMPRALSMAGESFELVQMPRPVFQIRYPDGRYALVDAAYDRATHEAAASEDSYSDAAWERLVVAMEGASQIVVTHEHADHLGGVASHPRPERIVDALLLNVEQADAPRKVDTVLPSAILDEIEPLDYAEATAIAPGVVLLRAAGHTPGSQMVFVQLADGRPILLVGDVVWNLDFITELKYRPRLVTDLFLDEDRAAVLDQIRALRTLHDRGDVQLVVSHDARSFATGLSEGFVLPRDHARATAER